ncbi:MAG: hypothetical protein IJM94_06505 [Clostridia bacterium]|nr:hypothetical protein [Clostridia bacterium]MBQ7076433.1 hypothetical protein [Clostridia bacterium]MBQ9997714.1 hypothetical protein [Clostridia bacterium]
MIKVLMGEKGSGKTKLFIEMVNKASDVENGNVVCITKDNRHLFDLKSKVRMSDTSDFSIKSYEALAGFISGIVSRDYDITHIFVDSITKLTGMPVAESDGFFDALKAIADKFNIKFTITISADAKEATDKIKGYLVEL